MKRIFILGADGFVGSHLVRRILSDTPWKIVAVDRSCERVAPYVDDPRVEFELADATDAAGWVEQQVARCDVVVPLMAIANPASYVRDPLAVFEVTFEENLRIVRHCATYATRLVFPSTSEVYGMSRDLPFHEDRSSSVLGPVHKQRWIYAASKQLLERVIWAHGQANHFDFTLFRPFNWIGPGQDSTGESRRSGARVVTSFIESLLEGAPLKLVDGGEQSRCFTDIDDGIECLLRILENANRRCDNQVFNVGNPENLCTVADLARRLLRVAALSPAGPFGAGLPEVVDVPGEVFYGPGYQDVPERRPSIEKAQRLLGWQPVAALDTTLRRTFDWFVAERDRRDHAAPRERVG